MKPSAQNAVWIGQKMTKLDLTGQRFGMLVAIQRVGARWACQCDCGAYTNVPTAKLRNGHTKSCGCYRAIASRAKELRHGLSRTRTHNIWLAMRRRCSRSDQPNFKWYGGRGIRVCARWESFDHFLADMGECPDGYELDRINGDGHYEPGNCRWVTHKDNCAKGRRNYAR